MSRRQESREYLISHDGGTIATRIRKLLAEQKDFDYEPHSSYLTRVFAPEEKMMDGVSRNIKLLGGEVFDKERVGELKPPAF